MPAATRTRWRVSWALRGCRYVLAGIAGWLALSARARQPIARAERAAATADGLVGLEEAPALSPGRQGRLPSSPLLAEEAADLCTAAGGRGTARPDERRRRSLHARAGHPIEPRDLLTPGAQPGEAGTIWEIPALGGTSRRLVNALGPGDPSHDGTRLAFFRFREGAFELPRRPARRLTLRDRDAAGRCCPTSAGRPTTGGWPSAGGRWVHLLAPSDGRRRVWRYTAPHRRRQLVPGRDLARRWLGPDRQFVGGSLMPYPPTYNLWKIPHSTAVRTRS